MQVMEGQQLPSAPDTGGAKRSPQHQGRGAGSGMRMWNA
jgi:hypothetical protein